MAYRNDSELVIANKYGMASSLAKAELYETYDRLRDLTVSGYAAAGSGFGSGGNFLWQLASLFSPGAFMPMMGGSQMMNIPGTSYWSPVTGATSAVQYGSSAFGIGNLGSYPGFPSGAAPIQWGFGTEGVPTGGAASMATGYAVPAAGITGLNAAAYAAGTGAGFSFGQNIVMPVAGMVSGWGGLLQAMAPYMGQWGLGAIVAGNLMQGTGNAAVAAYQNVTGRITSNADIILSDKVRNIETVVKMLDTQAEIVRKGLKDKIEGDSKLIQNL
ncbi:hypothetical protein tpqmel_0656 [Candidatus Gastranaerophilus sp. (ex Termes propinquus)]|nr:hypothetical protein tpqmel_0656 [Candidatus Gastranaerophilus sp. (ex Termes propinquus)]